MISVWLQAGLATSCSGTPFLGQPSQLPLTPGLPARSLSLPLHLVVKRTRETDENAWLQPPAVRAHQGLLCPAL